MLHAGNSMRMEFWRGTVRQRAGPAQPSSSVTAGGVKCQCAVAVGTYPMRGVELFAKNPHVARRRHYARHEFVIDEIRVVPGVRARNNCPFISIPVYDQRVKAVAAGVTQTSLVLVPLIVITSGFQAGGKGSP